MASEVTLALGLRRPVDSSSDFVDEGLLVPTFRESIDEYNFLKSASFSRIQRTYPRAWQKNTIPAIWPRERSADEPFRRPAGSVLGRRGVS